MTTGLGYGTGLVHRETGRNNSATVDIAAGAPVKLLGSVGASGIGDEILLVELETAASHLGTFGVAEKEMLQGSAVGEGEWGHVITKGMTKCKFNAAIAADTAIAVKVTTGDFMKATGVQVDAGIAVGKTLAANSGTVYPQLITCYVNFENRAATGSSGYDGAET